MLDISGSRSSGTETATPDRGDTRGPSSGRHQSNSKENDASSTPSRAESHRAAGGRSEPARYSIRDRRSACLASTRFLRCRRTRAANAPATTPALAIPGNHFKHQHSLSEARRHRLRQPHRLVQTPDLARTTQTPSFGYTEIATRAYGAVFHVSERSVGGPPTSVPIRTPHLLRLPHRYKRSAPAQNQRPDIEVLPREAVVPVSVSSSKPASRARGGLLEQPSVNTPTTARQSQALSM